ncbi:MAG: GuaB3 family IMP dehydrogenase-related protein [Armatimonadota bacterium]|nr:GuaB3 family IMP dehydrogenase-related protein [Armatimonadota bacterium]MDR7448086.1 GuaB3 family IMP dehydrogenase-related protein [Armatimonadota bacterium]MDR7459710.1 GuaB3 family IMP dehydrogenase-related protein [Armatimonadota bacterium]MDR7478302.1 GuaB3 family IMP dehydrogenase-related protein [Armatimonadota bacterium]MDR7487255.1 GuaB3 family IMP dehydrogenase-related protein [Armatimonadota bacterium]
MMPFVGRHRTARTAYGFDDIALAPGTSTVDPEDVDLSWRVGDLTFPLPFLGAAMDSVVDVRTAALLGALGAAGVLNLEGLQTRYPDPEVALEAIASASPEEAVARLQEVYRPPVREELVAERVAAIKAAGVPCLVSVTPAQAERLVRPAVEAGADAVLVQSTVVTERHRSRRGASLSLRDLTRRLDVPVMVGNCVTYDAALQLLDAGAAGVFVGVGPGAACTSRRVLGVGVPQATAIADVAAARDEYRRRTGVYVPVVADGGIGVGGEVAKAIACGADAVMLGSALARAEEAPGRGFHWGMATPHAALPRGTRIRVGTSGTLRQILLGPAVVDDGSQNLAGALRTALGMCGATTLAEMHEVEIVLAPALATEGKGLQFAQRVGQGR